jgi:UDP:flavonoid glycosyltransferase YjiC (YdhE family)
VAATIEEWEAGRALAGDAGVDEIRAAALQVLSDPAYRRNARARAEALAGIDGASNAADEIEALVPAR